VNSDKKTVTLNLSHVAERAMGFEWAYNPHDCVEVRWAAPADSDERKPCRQRAPQDQLAKMTQYRAWFAARTRPSR
jgi:hypothetical protein